ncbi:MAG: choice-of-anchor D domain-containing protein, partial [Georgfuchsia sp.]
MFYHDHAWGITRLNVYVGEAAGYLITDDMEQAMVTPKAGGDTRPYAGVLSDVGIGLPLVIEDKTFVDPDTIVDNDPTWAWGSQPWTGVLGDAMTPVKGDFWWPHVYMTAQNPYNPDFSGIAAYGRWHYGPWFWPPTPVCGTTDTAVKPWCISEGPRPNPYYDENCDPGIPASLPPSGVCQPPEIPGVPDVSWTAEAFLDVMTVNGTAYPKLNVDPKPYRLRILNASHDRFLNLQLYKPVPIVSSITVGNPGSGYDPDVPPAVTITGGGAGAKGATAVAIVDPDGTIAAIEMATVGSGYSAVPTVTIDPPVSGTQATATAAIWTNPTEVGMVPAVNTPGFPSRWPRDSREGGVPDPATSGPAWIYMGSEGGFLPKPVLIKNNPVVWNLDVTMFNVGNVSDGSVIVAPAERADLIVDFSQYAGQTLIVYNDAPTAFPALDPHNDYYTGAPDRTDMGGYPTIPPGVGPNVRTVMQIVVSGSGGTAPANDYNTTTLATLNTAFATTGDPVTGAGLVKGVFAESQEPIIVGQTEYHDAYNHTFPSVWPYWGVSRIGDNYMRYETVANLSGNFTFTKIGAPGLYPAVGTPEFDAFDKGTAMSPKAIHDEMGGAFDDYGRMSAKLGLEVQMATVGNSTFALQNYVDPASETMFEDGVQLWKITHNGVDTHPIHFHLFDVQVVNRVGWDGFIRKPDPTELGWKDTVRMSPLEDTIVAIRPVTPKVPFGIPESIRPLNPMYPALSPTDDGTSYDPAFLELLNEGFSNVDQSTGGALASNTLNRVFDYDWEYVWHCHILSHEENDMMRPMSFRFAETLPAAPTGLAITGGAAPASLALNWTDTTPWNGTGPSTTLGNHANEINFKIWRSRTGGEPYTEIGTALANATSFEDVDANPVVYQNTYYVEACNAAGCSSSGSLLQTAVTVSPANFTYDNQLQGTTSGTEIFTLTNTGNAAISMTSNPVALSGANPADYLIVGQTCTGNLVLAPSAACTVTIRFKPTAPGARPATLSFND